MIARAVRHGPDSAEALSRLCSMYWPPLLTYALRRGGIGVVYRAEDRELQRTAAVKQLLAWEFARLDLAKHFKQKAQM
ncbi:MAG: hypothetical protein HC845_11160 [Akkermansiaceae bacterium]|nr:hypothetical protein [Akkermansiaceae bacterium]